MSILGLLDERRYPITFDNELDVPAGSREDIRVPGATHACRWCGRDLELDETTCRHGCGSSLGLRVPMSATRIKIGDKWVEFVTEDRLILTDREDEAALYTWEGQVRAQELIQYHQRMDAAEETLRLEEALGYSEGAEMRIAQQWDSDDE